jgi:hypothetical protein
MRFCMTIGSMAIWATTHLLAASPVEGRLHGEATEISPLLYRDDAPFFQAGHSRFKLDPDQIYAIAKAQLHARSLSNQARPEFFADLFAKLKKEFPFLRENPWTINNYYGATGHLKVLYASASEYLIIYGSDIGVRGQTGRYGMDIRTIVIEGEHRTQLEKDPLALHIHHSGDRLFLPKGEQKIYALDGWILECGQGRVWTTFPNVIWFNDWHNTWDQMKFAMQSMF